MCYTFGARRALPPPLAAISFTFASSPRPGRLLDCMRILDGDCGDAAGTLPMSAKLYGGLLILICVWLTGWPAALQAAAQQPVHNLLINGDLETPYYAQGASTRTVPQGWGLWVGAGLPDALPHKDSPQVHSGTVSWLLRQNGSAFTAAGYQQVNDITPGILLKLTAYAWAFACDDTATRCAIATSPYVRSDSSAGVSVRVGIDPTGGLDPLSSAVQWSSEKAPYDQWAELHVTAIAQSSTVTVYLFATQQTGLALNSIYWDTVTLVALPEQSPTETPTLPANPTATVEPSPTPTLTPLAPIPIALSATTGSLCIAVFEDLNTNAVRDEGEPLLAGVRLLVTGVERADTLTSGETDPLCVELAPGAYEVAALPPEGTGLTGTQSMLVTVLPGQGADLAFAAARGYMPPAIPTIAETQITSVGVDAGLIAPPLDSAQGASPVEKTLEDQLYDYSGLIVLALAVMVGGGCALALLALRRPT